MNWTVCLCPWWIENSFSNFQGLVMAGLADMTRPADKLSTSQSAVLTATGETGFEWDSSDLSSSESLNLSIYSIFVCKCFNCVALSVQRWTWLKCAKGCLLHLLSQSFTSNKSYLLDFCQNIDSVPMDNVSTSVTPSCCPPPGLIWSRYSLVIIPKNWNLFAVNFFVGSAGASQLYRIWRCVCVCGKYER